MNKVDLTSSRIINDNGLVEYKSESLIDLMLMGEDISKVKVRNDEYIEDFNKILKLKSTKVEYENNKLTSYSADEISQKYIGIDEWLIPEEYKSLNIIEKVINSAENELELNRIVFELETYTDNNMIDLLKVMVYLVDVFRKNNIVYGVGRGSSVASFVLYKLGVHRINSLKYDIDFSEFLS